jgi:replicative DNA helicase
LVSKENVDDLLDELKSERAYSQVAALLDSVSQELLPDNSLEQAEHMREVLAEVLKSYSPHSDISVKDGERFYEAAKQRRALAKNGQTIGMPTLIPSIDYHWDGLLPGRLYSVIGRPGQGKSYTIAYVGWIAVKTGYNLGIFSPEMNEFEHTYRMHTLASRDPEVQAACDLTHSFRNRDLMRGTGFDLKAYKRFCEYFNSLPGECYLHTKKYRKNKITTQYIASRIEDLGLHGVVADPISKISVGAGRSNKDALWEAYDKVQAFQDLIEEHNVFGVATNWSTRQQGRNKSEKAPDLDDTFGADALAQESDHFMGLIHDEEDRTLTMRCSKSRFSKSRFNVTIEFHPNTGEWHEVNMDGEVYAHRSSLNGKALPNGTSGSEGRPRKSIVKKAIAGINR